MSKYFFDKKPTEECGLFGVFNNPDASSLTALGLHANSTEDKMQQVL